MISPRAISMKAGLLCLHLTCSSLNKIQNSRTQLAKFQRGSQSSKSFLWMMTLILLAKSKIIGTWWNAELNFRARRHWSSMESASISFTAKTFWKSTLKPLWTRLTITWTCTMVAMMDRFQKSETTPFRINWMFGGKHMISFQLESVLLRRLATLPNSNTLYIQLGQSGSRRIPRSRMSENSSKAVLKTLLISP